MRLQGKLTLYSALSKGIFVLVFVLLLPSLITNVAAKYTDYYLGEQKKKVLQEINRNGLDYYLQGDSTYGSYTLLKDEFISLEPASRMSPDSIFTARRVVETDTLTYRLLDHVFHAYNKIYLLEIGRTEAAISQYNRPLQRVALFTFAGLILITLLFDLIFSRILLRPLTVIIETKLKNRKFPFREVSPTVKTSTTDFRYLDQSIVSLMEKIRIAFDKEREFTSNASHELLTPISILQNKIENLLLDEELDNDLQARISAMLTTLNRLRKIINALLFISRIENAQYALADTVSTRTLVSEVFEELSDRAISRNINLQISMNENRELTSVNRTLLFQLLFNLVNNAIRYNKEGGVVRAGDDVNEAGEYEIKITDTGIGIATTDIDKIFDRFKKTSSADGESNGLGLSIVKSIAEYHRLRITVSSEEGKGSTFAIIFPN